MTKGKNKLYLVIGASCSGKTSFTENTFFKGEYRVYKDLMPITETKDYYFIGKFGAVDGDTVNKLRRKGTDTINRQDIKNIKEQVDRLKDKPVVLEGVRICSYKLMDYFADNYDCRLFLMNCSFEKSLERNCANSSSVKPRVIKQACSLSKNFYNRYWEVMNGSYLNTDDIEDFSRLNYDNYKDFIKKGSL